MSHSSKRTRSTRRTTVVPTTFGSSAKLASQPWLVTATDLCLWGTMIAVAIGFGGRMATGQFALVVGASVTAFCWLLHLLVSSESRYTWSGSEWLWGLGILVGVAQILPLPAELMLKLAPQMKDLLPLWFDNEFKQMFPAGWNQLSMAPWETTSGLATFVSYALMFLVAAQRIRTLHDVENTLCVASITVVVMMLFAQLQFLTSNGKFFWTYEHPYMDTDSYPLGCFTNRNHLAQFLSLGTAPLLWWLLRRLQQQEADRATRQAMPAAMHAVAITLLLTSLGGIALTVLMTLSRGGLMALGLASLVTVALMCRIGLASIKFGVALVLLAGVTGGLFSYSKYETILTSRLEQTSGRSDIWQANIQVARDFPLFGTGIGTHADAYHLHFDSQGENDLEYSHAESGYLQVASESGLAGLIVALLVIVTSFWWCFGALWNADVKVTSAATAIVASLTANVAHAVSDFFWYTPSCMLLLAIQLACAARLYRLTRRDRGAFVFSFRLPRLVSLATICLLLPVAAWMFQLKQPALLAEPHRIEAVLLSRSDERDLTDEEKSATNLKRLKESLLAAKFDPRNAVYQESAATAYLQLFDLKQEQAENTMSANMIRDAVKASQFESVTVANEWMERAVGSNLKLLRLAAKSVKRSLGNCPLRVKSYILLTEISFLSRKEDERFQSNCLAQALKLRPLDADTLYLVGKSALQDADLERTLLYWRPSFERSSTTRQRIAEILAEQMSPEFFEKEFHPDWRALEVIGKAFALAGRDDEAEQVLRDYIRQGMIRAKSLKSDQEIESTLIAVRNTCREIHDIPAAAEVLGFAAKRLPQSFSVRYMLSLDLMESNRWADAAEHLKWCAAQRPDDANLQKMAARAVTERLKQPHSVARRNGDGEF